MNLFKETARLVKWTSKVVLAFASMRPFSTFFVTVVQALSEITSLLAFLLPLKVILLVATPGVPRYFRFFIDPADKEPWIAWLSMSAVIAYLLTVALDFIAERVSEASSRAILENVNQMALAGKQRRIATSIYYRFTHALALAAFAGLGLTALGVVNPPLIASLLALILAEFLITAVAMRSGTELYPGRLRRFIRQNRRSYLRTLVMINFLAAFFIVLAPFLLGLPANALIAIISIMLLRRLNGAMVESVDSAIDLYLDRDKIEPLVFPKKQQRRRETEVSKLVRVAFDHERRTELVIKHVGKELPEGVMPRVEWQDSPIRGAFTFLVGGENDANYQLQVFGPKQAHLLSNEEFLFTQVTREELHAPEVLGRFQEGIFECQIVRYGQRLTNVEWREHAPGLITHYWSLRPPRQLVSHFNAAHQSLHRRFNAALLQRCETAADTAKGREAYEFLLEALPDVRTRLARVPLYIYNGELSAATAVLDREGRLRATSWVRWSLEPIGVGRIRAGAGWVEDAVAETNRRRKLKEPLTVDDVLFVNACWNIERAILRARYESALEIAANRLMPVPA